MNYLYFRKMRPASFSHTMSADQAFTIDGVLNGGDAINHTSEIATITVTPADGTNAAIGGNYLHPGAGNPLILNNSAITSVTNNVFTFDNSTADTNNGYTFENNDIVTLTFGIGLETFCAYPASRLLTVDRRSNTITEISFKPLKGSAARDYIGITHAAGKHLRVCEMINDAINFKPQEGGRLVTCFDGHDGVIRYFNDQYSDIGVTGIEYIPESGY